MNSKITLFGHSVHQMLVIFPVGLLATSVVFDVAWLVNDHAMMATVAYWLVLAGCFGALVAALFGTIDWLNIPKGTHARRIGALHGCGNLLVVLLFAISAWLRSSDPAHADMSAYGFSFIGFAVLSATAWLDGEPDRAGVGVHEQAGVDAPASLRFATNRRSTWPY